MTPRTRANLEIHFCVFIWGFTSILGKAISLSATHLVLWRLLIAVAFLACIPGTWREIRATPRRFAYGYAAIGVLLAAHWVAFFASIKLADASVGAACLGLSPAALAVVEPLIRRRRFDPRELALGLAVAPGVGLIVRGVPAGMRLGVLVGLVSTAIVAVSNALNKRLAGGAGWRAVSWLELGAGVLLLTATAPLMPHEGSAFACPGPRDFALLVVLAVGCTVLPFALYLAALRHLSAFAVQLAVVLEPAYAIVLAAILFGENRELSGTFYAGAGIVVAVLFVHGRIMRGAEA